MSLPPPSPKENTLLAALPKVEFERLSPHLQYVQMPLGKVIYEPGVRLNHAYFPTTSIVSLLYETASGASAETASVGNEGVVGVSLFMGGDTTTTSATVIIAGYAWRLESRLLKMEFSQYVLMQTLLLRYTQALMTQISQTAVCNRHHTVEQQLCRWLLTTIDRIPSGELNITQDLIARMLGVRREGVTESIGNLQRAGLISCRRGHITVLARPGLEKMACECYPVVKKEMDRLLCDFKRPQSPFAYSPAPSKTELQSKNR